MQKLRKKDREILQSCGGQHGLRLRVNAEAAESQKKGGKKKLCALRHGGFCERRSPAGELKKPRYNYKRPVGENRPERRLHHRRHNAEDDHEHANFQRRLPGFFDARGQRG